MTKASTDMIELTKIIENSDDIRAHYKNLCGLIARLVTASIELHINL